MSEYQYYEFQAIDRPLDIAAQKALRALSSRAQITATSFTNTYQWGDFKGNADTLMNEWFDLHLYLANWGTRRLMIRIPERFVDRRVVDACLRGSECAKSRVAGDHLILDIELQEVETEWDDGPGWLASLAPLRADLLSGDPRLLYLIWLMSVEFDLVSADTPEPVLGVGPMTGSLEAFTSFFCLNPDLIAAAAERDGVPGGDSIPLSTAREVISGMTDHEKVSFLSRLFDGEPHIAIALRSEVKRRLDAGRETPKVTPRTAGELRARAAEIGVAREVEAARQAAEERARQARKDEEKRREQIIAIARRGEGVWRDVEAEIERGNATAYDRAAGLLVDLKAVAEERDALSDFTRRVVAIRDRYARKGRFLQRIEHLA